MRRKGLLAAIALALALPAYPLPPAGQPPPPVDELRHRLLDGTPDVRAEAAAALVLDGRPEAEAAIGSILAEGDPAAAREILLFLADRPAPGFTLPLVAASRRAPLADSAATALDELGRRFPDGMLQTLRPALARSPLEDRAAFVVALGYVRSEAALPDLIDLLSGKDADAAMAALRRITTLPFAEPRDWKFWWEDHRNDSLADILRDAGRRMREENAALRAAVEREAARANDLEKAALKEKLRALREKKDAPAERALLEKEFSNAQPALRAWAIEEVRQAQQPADLLPGVLKAASGDPAVAVRVAAIRTAGTIGRDGVVEVLRACLGDADPAIRVAAVGALAEAGGKTVARDIEATLKLDSRRSVREAAIVALKGLKPRDFAPEANRLLEAEWPRPAAESVAAGLIELVGTLRDPSSIAVLVTVLQKSQDKMLRFRAVKSLGEIGDAGATEALTFEMDRPGSGQEKDIVAEAVNSLAMIGGDEARMRLETALSQFTEGEVQNTKARENAARGLAKIGTSDSIEPLMRCAKSDPDAAVKKEAWDAAFSLSDRSAHRLDALESLLALIGPGEAEAPWRVAVRSVIVKPGNFHEPPDRIRAHLRPLADDSFRLKDWPGALRWYQEAMTAFPAEQDIPVRVVLCRVRNADVAGALALGETLLPKIPQGVPAWCDLRRALIEARGATREHWRALALVPDGNSLPAAERDYFATERARLEEAIRAQMADFSKRLASCSSLPEEEKKALLELAKVAPPREVVPLLMKVLEGSDTEARACAAKMLEAITGIAVPADEGEARKKALDDIRKWPETQSP